MKRIQILWKRFENVGVVPALSVVLVLGLFWWYMGMQASGTLTAPGDLWHDQRVDFTQAGKHLDNPYSVPGFVYPPWTALFLVPLSWIPWKLAVLIEMEIYFIGLTLIIFRFGGSFQGVLLTLTSYMAFDLSMQTNIDWLPYAGLLVPSLFSGPLLLTKPQVALGAWIGYAPRRLLKALLGTAVILIISVVVWGNWLPEFQQAVSRHTLVKEYYGSFNLAPITLLPIPVSIIIGLGLALRAFLRRDVVLGLFAWIFFVPYMPFYSLILYFALLTIRLPLLAKIIYICTWVIYGGLIVYVLVLV